MRPAVLLTTVVLSAGLAAAGAGTALAGGGGGCHELTEGTATEVDLKESCFRPGVLTVDPGTTVTWTNRDGHDHVVMGTGWGSMENLAEGDQLSHRFDEAGAYPYTCFLHPTMNGVVIVGDDQASAVLAASATSANDNETSSGALVAAAALGAAAGAAAVGGTWLMGRRRARTS